MYQLYAIILKKVGHAGAPLICINYKSFVFKILNHESLHDTNNFCTLHSAFLEIRHLLFNIHLITMQCHILHAMQYNIMQRKIIDL